MVNDVARAYFYAPCLRDVNIELPPEDGAGPDVMGKLNLCLYVTWDAAANWQGVLSDHLIQLGFARRKAFPCNFVPAALGLLTLVHGDDYITSGELEWFDRLQS